MKAKAWKVDGIQPERDKNDVHGMIVSDFQCYTFGFGMAISDNVLQKVKRITRWRSVYTFAASELFLSNMATRRMATSATGT